MTRGPSGYLVNVLAPKPRGQLSDRVAEALRSGDVTADLANGGQQAEGADDAGLTLWMLYELHYRGFEDVDDDLEWNPTLLALRSELERDFLARLKDAYVPPEHNHPFAESLFAYVEAAEGPSLARFVQRDATRDQAMDVLRARSIYQLKEADPTTWAIPRLSGPAQVTLVALQYDEYGAGDAARQHAHLFARGLSACRLDPAYGAYIDDVLAEVLDLNNAVTLFGLHRRWRGAAMGFLAAFEATSSLPARQMAQGLRRLDLPDEIAAYYDEHIEADAVHEQLAVRQICEPLVEAEPELLDDVFFGAYTCVDLERRLAQALMDGWAA